MPTVQLSNHFTRADLERSEYAIRHGIANSIPEAQLDTWRAGLLAVVEPLTDRAADLVITSAYRSEDLNRRIGGSRNSQHTGMFWMAHRQPPKHVPCCAFDLILPSHLGGNLALWNHILDAKIPYDQLIWEFGTDEVPAWLHVSYVPGYAQRGQVLRARRVTDFLGQTRTRYDNITMSRAARPPRLAQIVSDTPPLTQSGTHAGGSQAHA